MIKSHITSLLANWSFLGLVKYKNYLLTGLLSILISSQILSQTMENITLPGTFEMEEYYSLTVYEGELYFSASDGSNGIYGALFKYDGTTVTQITLPNNLELEDNHPMIVYDGDLYMVLEDGSIGVYGALYSYDGTSFTQIDLTNDSGEEPEPVAPSSKFSIAMEVASSNFRVQSETDMQVYEGQLYIILEDGSSGIYGALYTYDGVDLTEVSLPENYQVEYPSKMAVYNGSLFLSLDGNESGLYEYNGSNFSLITMPETYSISSDGSPLVVYNDELYFAIGDGFVGIRGLLHKYDGTNVTQALPSNFEVQEEYGMEIYAGQIYMVLEDNGSSGEFYKFNGTSATKVGLPSNYEIEYDFDMEAYDSKLYGVFSDNDNSIYSGLFAYTASLDSKPPLEVGNCGRNILEFEQGAYAHVGTITDFSYSSGTFEAWVKKNDWTEELDDALFSNGIGFPFENSFYISFHPAVGLHFRYGGQSESGNLAAYVSTTSTDTLTDGSWHHIAATWYNNGSNTELVTYIDGIEIANQTSTENILLSGDHEFGIGEGILNYLNDFDGGAMSEMRLWDVARTQEEIEGDLNKLMTGSESGLIAYWPFDDAQGSTTAANLVEPTEVATLADFTDIPNAWVNYPLEIRADGNIVLKNGTYDFGAVGVDGSSEITFTITNNGFYEIELTGTPITLLSGTNTDQFTLDLSGTESTLASGESTTFTISFEPTSLDEKTASFSISNFEICSDPYEINISGTGLNDDCEFAEEITVYDIETGDYTEGSTESAAIFEGSISCATDGTVNDVWYKFTTTSTGAVEVNTSLGTASSLSGAVYLVCGTSPVYCVPNLPEKVFLPVGPNVDVYLQLWSTTEYAGTFNLRINELPNTWANDSWSAGSAPTSSDDALIISTYNTSEAGSLEVNNLEIFKDNVLYGGDLNIENSNYVIVNGDLTNNGGLGVQSEGSLITKGDISAAESNIFAGFYTGILRTTTFDQNTGRYSIVGSPIQSAEFSTLGPNAVIYAYDESELYNASDNMGADRFKTPAQLELLGMTPGIGYFSAFTGDNPFTGVEDGTVVFLGTPNFGNIEVNLSYTDHSTNSGDLDENDFEGFNLVSNPYPAAISVSSFFTENSEVDIDQAIYIWDDFGSDTQRGTNADYIVINQLGNTGTNSRNDGEERFDGYIRSVQGFFVKANSSEQTLQFTDDMKVTGNNSDAGYFRTGNTLIHKLILSHEESEKALIVGFTGDASLGKDNAYDALTFGGSDLQFYSFMVEGNTPLAIQGLPASYIKEIPIGFDSPKNGMHTIKLRESNVNSESIWLTDKYTGTVTDLSLEAYTFITQKGQHADRFLLSRSSSVLGTRQMLVKVFAVNKTLYIKSNLSSFSNFQIYNLKGNMVKSFRVNGTTSMDLSALADGVYLVSDGENVSKIVLK